MKLNGDQKRLTADILGNISSGWFVVGVAAPIFTRELLIDEKILSMLIGGLFSVFFYLLAIYFLRR